MRRIQRPKPGFTLVEVLVILAILAILAGVLVPSIANQVTKSDVSRVGTDLGNIRTGIEAFLVDIKRYPGDIEDLISEIDASDNDLLAADYPTGLLPKWSGPYLDIFLADDIALESGFGANIQDNFVLDSIGGSGYLEIVITPMTQADFLRVDASIDTDTSSTDGRFIWAAGGVAGDTAKYLALPVN